MTQTVNRMYENHDTALRAVTELRTNRLWDGHVYTVGPMEHQSEDEITAAIMKSYVPRAEARTYAKGIQRGHTLVTVHAPFGSAVTALHIMDKFGPIKPEISEPPRSHRQWDEAAPLSSVIGVSTLSRNPAPMSTLWNLKPLTSGTASLSEAVGLPELVDSKESLSAMVGLPLLSRDPTPFSSLFRIPLLW